MFLAQGKRTLNRWYDKDLREVADVPSGNLATHGDAVLEGSNQHYQAATTLGFRYGRHVRWRPLVLRQCVGTDLR